MAPNRRSFLESAHAELWRRFIDSFPFTINWRCLNERWKPRANAAEAVVLGERNKQEIHRRSPRRSYESRHRNPQISGAARAGVNAAIQRYRWSGLYMSSFFAAEGAWYERARPEGAAA